MNTYIYIAPVKQKSSEALRRRGSMASFGLLQVSCGRPAAFRPTLAATDA